MTLDERRLIEREKLALDYGDACFECGAYGVDADDFSLNQRAEYLALCETRATTFAALMAVLNAPV